MRRSFPLCRRWPGLLVVVIAVSAPDRAEAQRRDFHSGMRTGLGYAAVFPDVVAGVGAWHIFGGTPVGIFADAKMTVPSLRSDELHCPPAVTTCTAEWVEAERNDVFIRDADEYMIVNFGGIYAITGEFALMLGGGVARRRTVREYFDETDEPITATGSYFVDHEAEPSTEVQVVGGMLIRAGGHLAFRFGYESAPGGMSLGGYLILP